MKYLLFILLYLVICPSTVSQNAERQLPIRAEFKDGMIVYTLPLPYHNPSFLPVSIPRFIRSIRSTRMPEFAPSKQEMLLLLKNELEKKPENNLTAQMNYLKHIALYIYLSTNNTSDLPKPARTILKEWNNSNISFKQELNLVIDYLKVRDGQNLTTISEH